jgi:RNA polymerase sigma factor (sigma-70 family)
MSDDTPLLTQLHDTRRNFLALVEEIRPELHRYCARMTGSIADGEDVVQDTLARAYYELSALKEVPALRGWLFRIAHNRALDFLRRYDRRMSEPLEIVAEYAQAQSTEPDQALIRDQTLHTAVSRFLELVPTQRSCVILKDVLGHSLEDIAQLLDLSISAVKAALHRGRSRLLALSAEPAPAPQRHPSPVVARYVELFNARDWDAVRAMLADEVRLDVVSISRRQGRERVEVYFTNYAKITDVRFATAWLDGREVIAAFRPASAVRPTYLGAIELDAKGASIASIRDYYHVPYILQEAGIQLVT